MSDSPLSPDDIRAAAEVHRELGPQYSDAVVESFLKKIDQEIGTRIDTRLAGLPQVRSQPEPAKLAHRRTLLTGAAIGALGAGVPLTVFAWGMADSTGRSGWLAAIWIVVGVVFVAAMLGTRAAAPQLRGGTQNAER